MKIFFVANSGVYDYWRTAFRKHTKTLGDVISVKTDDLDKERMDSADVIIYFDHSDGIFYSHIALDLQMLNHAAMMHKKGIEVILISKDGNPGEVGYRIWWPHFHNVLEMGQINQAWYAFHTDETGPSRSIDDNGFNFINLSEFERRFILKDELHQT